MFFIFILLVVAMLVGLLFAFDALRPAKIIIGNKPEDFELPYENVTLLTEDNLRIAGWYIPQNNIISPAAPPAGGPPTGGAAAIIILHGYPAEKSDMLSFAKVLHGDFTTLLIDFRYFGESEGSYTTVGVKEILDARAAVDFLQKRGHERIGMLGFSMGGAVALMTAAKDERVNAVVAYTPYANLKSIGRDVYGTLFFLKYPLIEIMSIAAKLFLNLDISEASPEKLANKINMPVLLVHSRNDRTIPFSHALVLEKALSHNSNLETYFFDAGRHGALPSDFNERIADFFNRYLKKDSS